MLPIFMAAAWKLSNVLPVDGALTEPTIPMPQWSTYAGVSLMLALEKGKTNLLAMEPDSCNDGERGTMYTTGNIRFVSSVMLTEN